MKGPGRPPNKKDNSMMYLKISSVFFFFFILIVVFFIRFGADDFIDDTIKNLYLGVVVGVVATVFIKYALSCTKK